MSLRSTQKAKPVIAIDTNAGSYRCQNGHYDLNEDEIQNEKVTWQFQCVSRESKKLSKFIKEYANRPLMDINDYQTMIEFSQ